MAQPVSIGERERQILTAIVDTYISTGEPVGSRTLARMTPHGLSPATIRNVMADLADSGFLEQPHTSAGRVPTAAAYRFYVDQLSGEARLSAGDQELIGRQLEGISDVQEFMERTSQVLSLISHGVGVVAAMSGPKNALDHVYFSRQAQNKILAVVVTRSGVVRDRLLRVERDITQGELDLAANYVNENFRGWKLDDVQAELERRIESERSEYQRVLQSVNQLCQQGALTSDAGAQDVYIGGASNLIAKNMASEQDAERLRELLRTLEEKERVVELLHAYLDTRQEAVRVVIGLEQALPSMSNLVLIGAPAHVGDEMMGSLAVIGPTRIDYEHTITAVQYIARLFDKILNEPE